MTIHKIKLAADICDKMLQLCAANKNVQHNIRNTGARKGPGDKHDEILILDYYKNHKESGYENYISSDIDSLIPTELFLYFNLNREKCKIDIKKFAPGKIHIPHRDYYLNLTHGIKATKSYEFETFPEYTIDYNSVIRVWITLTPPKFGHVLIIENQAYYYLEQGTVVTWNYTQLHTAANLGYEDRYIMTITGYTKC